MSVTKENLFNPAKLTAGQKAESTHQAAMRIIDAEVTARERKTERLRQLRIEHEAEEQPAKAPKTRRTKAKSA